MSPESYNIFLSWSGPRAKSMAAALQPWLKRVIQSAKPFFSDKIETGAFWDESIKSSIQSVQFAIVCCTPENVGAPWINYEAGAIAERLKGYTAPWLLGSKPAGLKDSPLSRLMAREADESGTLDLLRSLNASLDSRLDEAILLESFNTHWPQLKAKLDAIPAPDTNTPRRSDRDMLEELVVLSRQIASNQPAEFATGKTRLRMGMVDEVTMAAIRQQGAQFPSSHVARVLSKVSRWADRRLEKQGVIRKSEIVDVAKVIVAAEWAEYVKEQSKT